MRSVAADVRLVAYGEQHLAATLEWLRDPELRRLIDSLDAPTPERHRVYWAQRMDDPDQVTFAIVDDAGAHVGNCGLSSIDRRRRKAELWIYLGVHRGAGSGAAAVHLLLNQAFDALGLNRVYLRVVADNPSAERFYRRLGFISEGRARQDTWHAGVPVDSVWYSMLAHEYRSSSTATLAGTPHA